MRRSRQIRETGRIPFNAKLSRAVWAERLTDVGNKRTRRTRASSSTRSPRAALSTRTTMSFCAAQSASARVGSLARSATRPAVTTVSSSINAFQKCSPTSHTRSRRVHQQPRDGEAPSLPQRTRERIDVWVGLRDFFPVCIAHRRQFWHGLSSFWLLKASNAAHSCPHRHGLQSRIRFGLCAPDWPPFPT
jgi:hypothetical protein